jgi:hypothetical protein
MEIAFGAVKIAGSSGTYPQGVNNQGEIVGGYYDVSFFTHGFVLKRGQFWHD